MGVSDEAVRAAQGKMIAQITNPEAWPPGYADGFNDAAKLCFEEIPAALLAALPHMQPAGEAVADETPPCSTHPDAPHGFNRSSSHSLDRYVCDCEDWTPPQQEAQGAVDSGSRLNQLWNGMYRMFNHGRENNTVSAQCEVQMLPAFLAGKDITAWNHPVPKTDTAPPAPVDVRLHEISATLRRLADVVRKHSFLPPMSLDEMADRVDALLSAQPSADASNSMVDKAGTTPFQGEG